MPAHYLLPVLQINIRQYIETKCTSEMIWHLTFFHIVICIVKKNIRLEFLYIIQNFLNNIYTAPHAILAHQK